MVCTELVDAGDASKMSEIFGSSKSPNDEQCLLFLSGDSPESTSSPSLLKYVRIEKFVCFRTIPRPETELHKHLDSVLKDRNCFDFTAFFGPSSVQITKSYFFGQNFDQFRTKFVALGAETAAEMEKVGLKVSCLCSETNASALAEVIKKSAEISKTLT